MGHYNKIRDIPIPDRPREKLVAKGQAIGNNNLAEAVKAKARTLDTK